MAAEVSGAGGVGVAGGAGGTVPLLAAITVVPSELTAAAAVADAVSAVVRSSVSDLLAGSRWDVVGDVSCAQALARAEQMLEQTLRSSAEGIESLARGLGSAADTYRAADAAAVPGAST